MRVLLAANPCRTTDGSFDDSRHSVSKCWLLRALLGQCPTQLARGSSDHQCPRRPLQPVHGGLASVAIEKTAGKGQAGCVRVLKLLNKTRLNTVKKEARARDPAPVPPPQLSILLL